MDTATITDETVFNKRVGRLDRKGVRSYSKELAKLCDEDGRFEIEHDLTLKEAVKYNLGLHIITRTTDGEDSDEDDAEGNPRVRVAITCNRYRYVNRDAYWLGDGDKTRDLVLVDRFEVS